MTGRIRLGRSLAAVALLACAIAARAGDAPVPAATISQDALSARQAAADGTLVVLDVRTPEEYAAGHVPGAINIPHGEVEARLAELARARDQDVVVYCLAGKRAALALEVLQKAGFTKLRHLDGDMQAWRANGRPVERAPERGPPPAML
jgi:phage shock protein E